MVSLRAIFISTLGLTSALAEEISYNQHVKPILSDKCFLCHGPDVANNKAGLRLDLPESAYALLKDSTDKHSIVPGNAAASESFKRMISDDPEKVMPPPESNLTMSEREIEIIRKWIDQGAEYEPHWAFTNLPAETPVPDVTGKNWPHNEIDHFVLKTLEDKEIDPSPEAAPLRWLRRTTFALTGLPPTPEEIASFQEDDDREAAVDRLLASSAYGEHMATPWLDAARYADSYGYQSDKLNTQWPYRDWVVRAFNANLPYDDFLTWQLAGDLLDSPTRDQRLATAFNRIHRLNNEGGAIFEEWRTENIADRVNTYGTAVLALTMECARCHDHKYDPITQRDYFSLFAFFNSIDENGMYDRTEKVPSPTMLLPTPEQEKTLNAARKKLASLSARTLPQSGNVSQWLASAPALKLADEVIHIDFNSGPTDRWYFSENDHNKAPDLPLVPLGTEILRRPSLWTVTAVSP